MGCFAVARQEGQACVGTPTGQAVMTAKGADERESVKKWGRDVIEAGFTVVPSVILQRQATLGLTSPELNVLLQLLDHWWSASSFPYPSRKAIAERMGVSPQTVQRHITKLARCGFIEIERRKRSDGGYTSSVYRFEGLKTALQPLAVEGVKERQAREEAKRTARKAKPGRKVAGS